MNSVVTNGQQQNCDDRVNEAICLKEFLDDFMKNELPKNEDGILLTDLTQLISKSPHCYFLRDYFKIDSRSLLKRIHM